MPWVVWLCAVLLLGATWWLAERAGDREERRVQQHTEAFARTYASEMEQDDHWKVASDAAPDDPHYLSLIEDEKRWLKLNPTVNDIYTLRRRADGKHFFVVDSETDYDHNGKYEGEREQRTAIGEVYEQEDKGLEQAFSGKPNFEVEPVTDRWGTWVSAFMPLHDPQGKVEAVLGVDFEAGELLRTIAAARTQVVALMGLVVLVVLGSSTLDGALRADSAERQRTLDALHVSEQHFRQLVHALPTALFVCDAAGRITLYNKAAAVLWGRDPGAEAKWTGAVKMRRPEGSPLAPDEGAIGRCLRTGTAVRGEEFTVERPDGTHLYVLSYTEPIKDRGGKLVGAVDILVDLTERRQAEVRLARVNRQLQEVSRRAGMAEVATSVLHNVGNVLNSANVSLEMAGAKVAALRTESLTRLASLLTEHQSDLAGFVTGSPQGSRLPQFITQLAEHFADERAALLEELGALGQHVEHINEIIATQQDFARGRETLEELPVAEVIEDALRLNSDSLDRHGAKVVCEMDAGLRPFPLDRHKLIQILVNLIQNAKQAMEQKEGGEKRLTLRAARNGGGLVRVEVSDTGVGIPAENLPRVFEHGFTTRNEGHGFGLHASALAAREMGGSLQVQSAGAGRGATFTLELPLPPRLS